MTHSNYKLIPAGAEPIKNQEDIEKIRSIIKNNPRNLLLFDIITQTGMGMKKVLRMKAGDILDVKPGERIAVPGSKTGKYDNTMTEIIYESFLGYKSRTEFKPDDFLFKSKKGNKPINLSSASNMIKEWFDEAGIKSIHCATTLRRTWEYNLEKKASEAESVNKSMSSILSSGIFKPIKNSSAQEIVYQKLLEAIISCKIPPGSRLTTSEISRAFDVSHAPARVALNWLEAKGFISSKKKKASIVKELSFNELEEIMRIRYILECAAAELSYKACTEETVELVEFIIQCNEKSTGNEEHDKLNTLFHQTLYRDANMPILMQLILDLCTRVSPYALLYEATIDITEEYKITGNLYHREMIKGMRNKNLDMVKKNLELDLAKSTLRMKDILAQREKDNRSPISFAI